MYVYTYEYTLVCNVLVLENKFYVYYSLKSIMKNMTSAENLRYVINTHSHTKSYVHCNNNYHIMILYMPCTISQNFIHLLQY